MGRVRNRPSGAAVVAETITALALICAAPVVVAFFVMTVLGPIMMASRDAEIEREAAEMGVIRK